jgi:hypothetical protein
MKNFIVILFMSLLVQNTTPANSKNNSCSDPVRATYSRVMNTSFVKEYTKCPVIIEAEFFKNDYPKNLLKPQKFRKKYIFQCVDIGSYGTAAPFSGESIGDFFVIDKQLADMVLKLKKGDKLRITGTTFAHSSLASAFQITPFFIVQKIEIIE